jgi:phosphatidate cytidylyltransferase
MAAQADPSTHWSKKPLTLRIISAAVLIPIVVAAVYAGHPAWDLLVMLFGGVMIWEWCRISARSKTGRSGATMVVTAAAIVFVFAVLIAPEENTPSWFHELGAPGLIAFGALCVTVLALVRFRWASLWFGAGVIYVSVPCLAIIQLRADPAVGLQQIFWIVALVVAADTGAYIAGRSIGGPKLAPRISPNKTWAGLAGAVVSAAVVGVITAVLMELPIVILAVVSGLLGIVAQAGDLAESAFKRHFGVKDASNIIPGHGGALDRVDGLIAVAAAVAGINYLIGSSVLTWL